MTSSIPMVGGWLLGKRARARKKRRAELELLTFSLLVAPLSMIQAAEGEGQRPAAEPDHAALSSIESIVVTARRRAETAQDVPVSITALSQSAIERYDLTSLEKVSSAVPQLVVSRAGAGSGAQLSLRGIGSNFTSIGIEQSVAVIVDGVYYGQGRIINEGFFDSAQIEVLKGPQALFFGKNATAGVISITTNDPTDSLHASARATYETESQETVGEAVLSGPLTDTLSARLAVRASEMSDGYFDNRGGNDVYHMFDVATGTVGTPLISRMADRSGPQQEQQLARLTLRWAPTNALTATLKAAVDFDKSNNPSWNVVPICPGPTQQIATTSPCTRDFVIYQSDMPREMADAGVPFARGGALFNDYHSSAVTGTLTYEASNALFTWVNNYNRYANQLVADYFYESPFVGGGAGGGWSSEKSRWNAFSTEARVLTTFEGPVNVLAGVYYQKTGFDFDMFPMFAGLENTAAPTGMRYVGAWKRSLTDGETMSGYAQLIYQPVDSVEITAGARYIRETKDSIFVQPYANPALVPAIYLVNEPVVGDQTFNNVSPEATVNWKPVDGVMLYAAYKTGFKSGGFSNNSIYGINTIPGALQFDGEEARGFEVGAKTLLWDQQLQLNAGAYRYKYTDLQIDFYNANTISYITTNAGSSKVEGVELEALFAPSAVAGLTLNGSVNYNRSRYEDFQGPCYGGQTIGQGCSISGPGGAPFQDLSGKPTANAPEWLLSAGVDYRIPLGNGTLLGLGVDARYSDSYYASPFNATLSRQPGYTFLNASARLAGRDDRWEVAVFGRNLTNRFVITGVYDITGTGSGTMMTSGVPADQAASVGMPRTVQLQFTWRYGN